LSLRGCTGAKLPTNPCLKRKIQRNRGEERSEETGVAPNAVPLSGDPVCVISAGKLSCADFPLLTIEPRVVFAGVVRINEGKTVFAQVMSCVPHWEFRRVTAEHDNARRIHAFSAWDLVRAITIMLRQRGTRIRVYAVGDGLVTLLTTKPQIAWRQT
jgi:hypothetical protein